MQKTENVASHLQAVGKKIKDYTCLHQFDEKPSVKPGCQVLYRAAQGSQGIRVLARPIISPIACRLYIADDVEYVEQDLEQLRVLFLADGQGLPAQDIEDLCTPVVDLLNVLQLETGILIKNFKDVCFWDFSYSGQLVFRCCALSRYCCCNHVCMVSLRIFVLQSCLLLCCGRLQVNARHFLTSFCAQKSSSLTLLEALSELPQLCHNVM